MTTKTIHYNTRNGMKAGKVTEAAIGFRAVNTDFTNNDQRQGYDIFYDDQASIVAPIVKRQLTRTQWEQERLDSDNVELI